MNRYQLSTSIGLAIAGLLSGCGPGVYPPNTELRLSNSIYENPVLTCPGGTEASLIFPDKTYSLAVGPGDAINVKTLTYDGNLIRAGQTVRIEASCKSADGSVYSRNVQTAVMPENFKVGDPFQPMYSLSVFTPKNAFEAQVGRCVDSTDNTKLAQCISLNESLGFKR